MVNMPRAKRGATGEQPAAADKRNFTIWAKGADADRIERAVKSASERAGFPVSTSAWLLAQVLKGVDEEEKRGGRKS